MKASVLNCSLKDSVSLSNTQLLLNEVTGVLHTSGVDVQTFRLADMRVHTGIGTDLGDGDEWPSVHAALVRSDIVVVGSPTWVGRPSSIAQRVLERMNAMISQTDPQGRPIAQNRVAGVVVTGNEDGAHHVISEICGGLIDIGFTIPGRAWTYWNRGPGPGPSYSETDEGHEWAQETARIMAQQLLGVARALRAMPLGPTG